MEQPSAVQLWGAIKDWYAEHVPEVLETLNPGADKGTLTEFEGELKREIGKGLPQGWCDVYLQNDGRNSATTTCGIFFGVTFLSLAEVHSNWHDWLSVAQEPFYDDMTESSSFYPAAAIQHKYAAAGWIPFAHDGGGNHLGVDLAPGPKGQVGQIINFGPDEENKVVIAPSFEGFLGWQLEQLQNGNIRAAAYEIDGESLQGVEVASTPVELFMDAIPKLFGPK